MKFLLLGLVALFGLTFFVESAEARCGRRGGQFYSSSQFYGGYSSYGYTGGYSSGFSYGGGCRSGRCR